MARRLLLAAGITFSLAASAAVDPVACAEETTQQTVRAGMHKAVQFFRKQVSVQGGYLWRYSSDLKRREGEGIATAQQAWVQPPGTPSVGGALLAAYQETGDPLLLDAARETARALVAGQLRSGGWDYRIEFDPERRRRYAYRVASPPGRRNTSTLDDNTTQEALRFLMRIDQTLEFKDSAIHDAVRFALKSLIETQYPNGAWPQRFQEPPDPKRHPVVKASYPESWARKYPKADYRGYYTFNDNTIADMIDVMFLAGSIYKDKRYRAAAEKAGDFILLAQMPDPQPAWAQQYNARMHPAWARKFEPPAVTGGESQGVLQTLLVLYERTGKRKYLAAVRPALEYLQKSQLPDGRLARFYELKTNRPLYFTRKYALTYKDDDLPTHYGFIVGSRLSRIDARYRRLAEAGPPPERSRSVKKPRLTAAIREAAADALRTMDHRGAWVEAGRLKYHPADRNATRIIDTRTFIRRLQQLSRFLAATR